MDRPIPQPYPVHVPVPVAKVSLFSIELIKLFRKLFTSLVYLFNCSHTPYQLIVFKLSYKRYLFDLNNKFQHDTVYQKSLTFFGRNRMKYMKSMLLLFSQNIKVPHPVAVPVDRPVPAPYPVHIHHQPANVVAAAPAISTYAAPAISTYAASPIASTYTAPAYSTYSAAPLTNTFSSW